MDSVLNLPARATQMHTSVHGQPVAGIVSAPEGTEVPTLLRSNTLLMQKVGRHSPPMPELDAGSVGTLQSLIQAVNPEACDALHCTLSIRQDGHCLWMRVLADRSFQPC